MPEGKSQIAPRIARWIIRSLKPLTFAYILALAFFLPLLRMVGERNWVFSLLLYLPPLGWLLPLLFLLPLAYVFQRRLCRWQLVAVFLVLFVYMDFHWSFGRSSKKSTLTVVTNNIGQRKMRGFYSFVEREVPDVIAVQETWTQPRAFSRNNPDRFVTFQGQFGLISKLEIKNSGVVPIYASMGPVAAWFELNFQGKSIVIYNVHLPTPRKDFLNLRGQGFLAELFRGGGIYSGKVREDYAHAMAERIRLAEELLAVLRKEKRPFIVAGDFNMPSEGYIRRLFTSEFTDVFAARGRGYGLTFPGSTFNPLSFFGPWLRLDYVFCDGHWGLLDCRVEPRDSAQHRAVVAKFELNP